MRKPILIAVSAILILAVCQSLMPHPSAGKLYPELEAYFKKIDAKGYKPEHLSSLETLKNDVSFSDMDYNEWNCIFYCTENSFRSQTAQVFLETLAYAKKHRRLNVYSVGQSSGTINPRLIEYLSEIGYKISKTTKNDKDAYEVRYSDAAKPILLYSKSIDEDAIPTKDVISVIVCDRSTETSCKDLKIQGSVIELPFKNASSSDSKEKIQETVNSIAVSMQYVTDKKRN